MGRSVVSVVVAVFMLARVAAAEIREAPPAPTEAHAAAAADAGSGHGYWSDIGYGSLAVITNVFYMPVKVGYALLGLPVGGLAFVLTAGDSQVSDEIWGQSLGGDYVITPSMLNGEQTIHFNGRPKE